MKMTIFQFVVLIVFYTSVISAVDINGRFVVVSEENLKISILLQFNANTGNDDLGGSSLVIGFDNLLLNIPINPQRNVDYYFHNFSGGTCNLVTITQPSANMF